MQRAICALIFTDVELSVDNDPTERLLNRFVRLGCTHPATRPRVGERGALAYIHSSLSCFNSLSVLNICRLLLSHLGGLLTGHRSRLFQKSSNSTPFLLVYKLLELLPTNQSK